jgi:ubiquitin C-terminal hydrolase
MMTRIRFIKDKNPEMKNLTQEIFGLPNIANSCYMNSIIQIIMRNPKLLEDYNLKNYLLKKTKINKKKIKGLALYFLKLIKFSFSRNNLLNDHLILHHITEKILKEMNKIKIDIYGEMEDELYSINNENDTSVFYKDFLNGLSTFSSHDKIINIIHSCYQGKINNYLECNHCYETKIITEDFVDINITAKSSIEDYFNFEVLENFLCPNCDKLSTGKYYKKIIDFPKNLVFLVNYNSFQEIIKKNFLEIEIEENKYKLYAYVNYLKDEDQEFNHYKSVILIEEKWILFNDEEVREINPNEEFFKEKITMLFFTRI